jgi:seryl-tRNA synthetase
MIDYEKISAAIKFYSSIGYKYIEAPWFVSDESMAVTCPPDRRCFNTFAGNLVASGEQSFIEMRKIMKPGRYCCATPCFRDESSVDDLHLLYFFKVELINVAPDDTEDATLDTIQDALEFFKRYGNTIRRVRTDIGHDLYMGDVEIGSYGFRSYDGFDWIYGTGCAEPRLSQAITLSSSV